ncbi:hypothetical protein BJ546DRAFT_116338 [Cryomyces antarcticus]
MLSQPESLSAIRMTRRHFQLIQHALADAYLGVGQVKAATEMPEHVVAAGETALAENPPNLLASRHQLAGAYLADEKAIVILKKVVEMYETLPEDHPGRLALQHVLACVNLRDGEPERAVAILEVVVRNAEALPEDRLNRLVSQDELARAYLNAGQVKKAVAMLEDVVRIRKAQPEDDMNRLSSQHYLACAYLAENVVEMMAKVVQKGPRRLVS